MKPPVGYLRREGKAGESSDLVGEWGQYYNYILAGNGLFIQAENQRLSVVVPIAEVQVRGLLEQPRRIILMDGQVPVSYFSAALDWFRTCFRSEAYAAITAANKSHKLYVPWQIPTGVSVKYRPPSDVVVDLHSHGPMRAFFSHTDDADDQGLRVSMVVGKLDTDTPEVVMRLGVYGYHVPIAWDEVFDGPVPEGVQVLGLCDEDIPEIGG